MVLRFEMLAQPNAAQVDQKTQKENSMSQDEVAEKQFVVIGAGPAGLSAAYELAKRNLRPVVFEERDRVGGLARTENYQGFHFDMGGHRFFTKVKEVNEMWREVLDGNFLRRPRLSRIYYNCKFFSYPLKPLNALVGLGFWESTLDFAKLPQMANISLSPGGHLRTMGNESFREKAFSDFL